MPGWDFLTRKVKRDKFAQTVCGALSLLGRSRMRVRLGEVGWRPPPLRRARRAPRPACSTGTGQASGGSRTGAGTVRWRRHRPAARTVPDAARGRWARIGCPAPAAGSQREDRVSGALRLRRRVVGSLRPCPKRHSMHGCARVWVFSGTEQATGTRQQACRISRATACERGPASIQR